MESKNQIFWGKVKCSEVESLKVKIKTEERKNTKLELQVKYLSRNQETS